MSLTIHPDPQESAGGYAFLELPGGSLGEGPVHVAVMEVYGNRWLGASGDTDANVDNNEGNWQGERHEFGPYPVHAHDGADWVRIGPEIVNKIDEYTALRIDVAGQVADISWPDDVPPRTGAAVLGGLQPTARPVLEEAGSELVGKTPESEPEPDPEPPETPAKDIPPPTTPEPAPKMHNLWQPIILVLFMTAISALMWYLIATDPGPAELTTDSCTRESLVALDGFAATEKAIRACGDAVPPETVLKIIEDASAREDPAALLLFATLYDGAETDARIETVIGLSFDHDAALAAGYYARAVTAGSDDARARLAVTCTQLSGSDETLAKGAYDDFCR